MYLFVWTSQKKTSVASFRQGTPRTTSFTHNRNALFPVKGQMIDRIAQFWLPRALRARVPYARLAITWPYTNRPYHRHTNAKFRAACGKCFSVRERIATRVLWSINNLEVLRSQLRTKRNLWEIYHCNESEAFSLAKYYWMASITENRNTIKRPRR